MAERGRWLKTFQVFLTRCVVASAAILRLACSSLSNSLFGSSNLISPQQKQSPAFQQGFVYGGEREIRTPGTRKSTIDFESTAFDHSAISP